MQNWNRLYDYIHDYQNLVYDYYAETAVAFLTTYYNIDKDNTVWEDEDIMGGAYERLGDLSGIKFTKNLLIPVFFIDEINTSFTGDERGLVKEGETTFVMPGTYGITPYAGDIVKLEQDYLRPTNDTYPIYIVSGVEIHPNTDKRFWKIKVNVWGDDLTQVEEQSSTTKTFFNYDKKIHTVPNATTLARMLHKHSIIKDRLSNLYDPNSGFYNVERT